MYIIAGIDRSTTQFQPRTRCEIKCCEWFALADLPANKKDCTPKAKLGVSANAFFMVLPFVKRVKRWVQEKSRASAQGKRNRNKSQSQITEDNHSKTKINLKDDSLRKSHSNSPTPRSLSHKKIDKKPHFKRQLFNSEQKIEFCAPSWLSFKFDKQAILDCFN